jgi:hypothetical protein
VRFFYIARNAANDAAPGSYTVGWQQLNSDVLHGWRVLAETQLREKGMLI